MALQRLNPPSLISARQAERGGYRITLSRRFPNLFPRIDSSLAHAFALIGKVTTALPLRTVAGRNFRIHIGSIFRTYNVMNSKKFILLSCVVPCVFAVSPATAQMRGHHAPMRAPMGRMPMQRAPMSASAARMPMHRASMLNSASRFRRFNDGDFDRDDGFRRHRFNEIIVFDNFGFPFFPFYYPYYPYPYGAYYPYGYGGDQGGYGSLVVQVQRRLASAGYYPGPIDGVIGSRTRRAIRAYERSHGLPVDGTIHRRLLATMGLA